MSLPSDSSRCLGIDIGGTKCAVILGDRTGTVVGRIERPTKNGISFWPEAGAVLEEMAASLCKEHGVFMSDLLSIGVSCGAPLNSATGTILSPPNLPGWTEVPIKAFFSQRFPGPQVFVENDANATALAEHRWGAGQGCRSLAYLTCGTGIGAGIILDGRLYRGKSDLAGEIGHAVIVPNGPLCPCGKRGCLEALASGSAIGRVGALKFGISEMTGKAVIELASSGNLEAQSILRQAAFYLGIGIANLLQTLDLERVIVGSLALYAGEYYMDIVRQTARENTWKTIFERAEILPAGLGKDTQDLSTLAIALPMEGFD